MPYAKCPTCGKRHKRHKYTGAICDMATGERRTRRRCPFHEHLCYGRLVEYYDTVRMFFDCGTFADYGYREWRLPEGVSERRWREIKRARSAA